MLAQARFVTAIALLAVGTSVFAAGDPAEATIRSNLKSRIPQIEQIDEVSKSAIPGLYEVRVNGTDIFYTDAKADYLIHGNLIDTKARRNLTEERVNKLSAIDYSALPLKDAFTIMRGNGARKLAVFEDPNCGYCKRFERDLVNVDNVTVQVFLYPILSADSVEKSKNIWCAKDSAAVFDAWMLREQPIPAASCDTAAVDRNLEFGRKHKITGTPTLIFADGQRVPGAINAKQIEELLSQAKN